MAKTEETIKLEKDIFKATKKQGVFGCMEVTIGWWGKERVDYITYDTKGIWRCFEIKVSKADFHSKAKKTFIGHYNYFVMPSKLYEQVKDEIPNHIGVYCGSSLVKRAKKQELGVDEQTLKDSMIRSLYREYEKKVASEDAMLMERYRSKIQRLERDYKTEKRERMNLRNSTMSALHKISEKYNIDYNELRNILREEIHNVSKNSN